ncbi:hypothetical protein, partial [Vreelandella olivaria]|uniref:hypothetical protein n=1 Tax=Vreelandella olivaria TaxID=390919 RepID=UPI00201F63C6
MALMMMSAPSMVQETEYQFGVRWSVNGMPSSLCIHNIMLNFTGTSSHLDTRLPISKHIKNGKNTINLNVWPLEYEPDSELRVSLLYRAPGENPNTGANVAFEVVMMPREDDVEPRVVFLDPGASLQPLQNNIQFSHFEDYDTLEVNFMNRQIMPTWCWEEGDVLSDSNATRASVAREYRRLYALFEAKNNDALMNASSTMIAELALASGESEAYVR